MVACSHKNDSNNNNEISSYLRPESKLKWRENVGVITALPEVDTYTGLWLDRCIE